MSVIAENVDKSFGTPEVKILKQISLHIPKGQFVSLTGRSGSGKSTLLYILSSLDRATRGVVKIDNHAVETLSTEEVHELRNKKIGFVFQFHYLIQELSALENVLMPSMKLKRQDEHREYAKYLLTEFGLGQKFHRHPRELSGGEQQRVAIARALVMEPEYLFADEPTGALDSANSDTVMNIIQRENKEKGTTVIMVTHDPDFALLAERQIHLVDGQVASDQIQNH